MTTAPQTSITLATDLADLARREGAVYGRSIGAQIEHWAKLGRAFEQVPGGYTVDRVRGALAGALDPADLTENEWQIFDEWAWVSGGEPSEEAKKFFADLRQTPGTVGDDEQGRLVRVADDGSLQRLDDA
jgi:hypothetical protein